MTSAPSNARGIAAMLFATASFVVCDTFMKLATVELPPFEVLFLRGVFATLCCAALLVALGQGRVALKGFAWTSVLRASFETGSVLCYIVALAGMPIADVLAIVQTAPLVLILLSASIFRERIGPVRIGLIAAGFVGALLVAQPDAHGISAVALLAFASAIGAALRDVTSRTVPTAIPALAVTFAIVVIVMLGSGAGMVLTEDIVIPSAKHTLYLLGAGVGVTAGHFGIFLAYRLGAPSVIAPFFYSFVLWAVLSGIIVFRELPNPVALIGIAAIVASGVFIVLLDRRKQRVLQPAPLPE
jgi:drug/metabolite transporter (DMT)-like permease